MGVAYGECCLRHLEAKQPFELCPDCGTVLIRCATCEGPCSDDEFCPRCHELTLLVESGQRWTQNERVAVRMKLSNQGEADARLRSVRYGFHCGHAFTHQKDLDLPLPSGALEELRLDGLEVDFAGDVSLDLELEVSFGAVALRLIGGALLTKAAPAMAAAGDINIRIDQSVDKAGDGGDINVHLGPRPDETPVPGPGFEQMSLRVRPPGSGGVSRATRVLVPQGPEGLPRAFFFARKASLCLGVARPEKHPQTDVCLRLYPERDGLNLDCNQTMSRSHFSFRPLEGELCLIDHSTNGTCVNGQPATRERPQPLQDGDCIAPWRDRRLQQHCTFQLRYHRELDGTVSSIELVPRGGSRDGRTV